MDMLDAIDVRPDGVGWPEEAGAVEAGSADGRRPSTASPRNVEAGELTPPPLAAVERRVLAVLATLMADEVVLEAAVERFTVLRAASGLGIGMDPSIVEGLRHAAEVLAFLRRRAAARR